MSMSRSTVRPTRTYFDHIDHDCDGIKLKDANGPLIVAKDRNDMVISVELSLDDLRALNKATAELLLEYRVFADRVEPTAAGAEPDATDVRRAAALALAKETLGTGMHPPEALLTLANWLLGNTDTTTAPERRLVPDVTVNVSGDLDPDKVARQIQQKLGRRATGSGGLH
jgi:hypothetical protein